MRVRTFSERALEKPEVLLVLVLTNLKRDVTDTRKRMMKK